MPCVQLGKTHSFGLVFEVFVFFTPLVSTAISVDAIFGYQMYYSRGCASRRFGISIFNFLDKNNI
jgi:hypothetical protein